MIIVADANIADLDALFGAHGEIRKLEGRAITRAELRAADVLLTRSVTPVDQGLLAGTPVRFVGSATIGTDHLDIDWLQANGIAWAAAPGCNADAAAQYTLAMMWLACERLGRDLATQSVGIIGRGNVGSRLSALLDALGMDWVANDPPLAEQGLKGLVSLEAAMDRDIVSLHVPLTRTGMHSTWRMLDAQTLGQLHPGALLVNAARGEVLDGPALLAAIRSGRVQAALDVWPGEPDIDAELLNASVVATPHVAGYSVEGKRRGTRMIHAAFCRHFGLDGVASGVSGNVELVSGREALLAAVRAMAAEVARDDSALRSATGMPGSFDTLRREYPPRHEYRIE